LYLNIIVTSLSRNNRHRDKLTGLKQHNVIQIARCRAIAGRISKESVPLQDDGAIGPYLGGSTSLSFSEHGSPPTPQCVLGIS
jgi:hypothetical protein